MGTISGKGEDSVTGGGPCAEKESAPLQTANETWQYEAGGKNRDPGRAPDFPLHVNKLALWFK